MKDQDKTKEQLLDELVTLRERIAVLENREQQAMALLESASLGIFHCDLEGRICWASRGQEVITGRTTEELAGACVWDRAEPAADRDLLAARLKRLVVEQPPPTPYFGKYVRKNGELYDVRVDWNYLRGPDGQLTGFVAIVSDITEQQQKDLALRESERRLSTLLSNLPGMAYRCKNDPQWTMEFLSEGCLPLTGYSPLVFTTNHEITYAQIIHPDDRQQVWEEVQRATAEKRRFHLEYRIRTAPGEEKWIWEQGVAVCSADGQVEALEGLMTDITDRKRAQEALQKAHDDLEQRVKQRTSELAIFRWFAEASGRGFGMADLEGRITYVNPTLCGLLGEERPENVTGKHVLTYYPEDYKRRRSEEIIPALFREGSWQGEQLILSRTGARIPVLQDSFLVRDENGTPFRLAVAVADITKLKQAEEALRASEEKYKTLVETSPDGVVMTDPEGRITFVSCRMLELHGSQNVDAILGRNSLEFIAPEDHQKFFVYLRRTLKEGVTRNVEYRFLRKDGMRVPGEVSTAVIRDASGRPNALVGILRDITERKRAEEILRQSLEQLQAIYDGMVDGLTIEDIETRTLVQTNASFCRMLGYTEAELKSMRLEEAHPPDAFSGVLERYAKHAETEVARSESIPFICKDGSILYVDVSTNRIMYNGRPALVCFFHDITERKQAQEALERERQSLWHMLEASDHERQVISYEIHDGLAQYLAAANMQLQVSNQLRESNPNEAKKAYDAAAQLVSQAHFEARRLISEVRPPVIDEVGLETAISHLVHEQRRRGGPKIQFRSSVQFGRLPAILENSLYRIAQEALTNAWRHSRTDKVRVTLAQKGQEVRLEVRDWGIGFAPESVERGHFGLEGIRQRVRLLGGRLKIESVPNAGTSVQVLVPIVEKQPER